MVGVLSNAAKRYMLGEAAEPRPKINEVEAFLDGDEELFQANKPGPFLQPADMTGPLTVQLLDSQGNVVAQVPVYNVSMTTGAGGRMDLQIEASFHAF